MFELFSPQSMNAPSWVVLSCLLTTAVYFRFSRLWLIRNADLLLLLAFSPALLLLDDPPASWDVKNPDVLGNALLFGISGLLLLRLCLDAFLVRRPRFTQNLNSEGMTFLAVCALLLLIVRVSVLPLSADTQNTVKRSEQLRQRIDASEDTPSAGPTTTIIAAQVGAISDAVSPPADNARPSATGVIVARILAVMAHIGVVAGLLVLGAVVFGEMHLGVSMATMYLLLPCTFFQAGELIHVLPAALILWAVIFWRRPVVAGCLIGLACGTLFFPVFLVPVWVSFYGRRRAGRFLLAWAGVGVVLLASVALTSADPDSFARQAFGAIDWSILSFRSANTGGFWTAQNAAFRIPVVVVFVLLLFLLTIWPKRKNLEHLLSASAAIIVATQFWYPQQGGVYLLWYMPLTLAVVFRPKLSHLRFNDLPPAKPAESVAPPAGRQLVTTSAGTSLFR